MHCPSCNCEHKAIQVGGVTLIACPAVPNGWLLPYYPPISKAEFIAAMEREIADTMRRFEAEVALRSITPEALEAWLPRG